MKILLGLLIIFIGIVSYPRIISISEKLSVERELSLEKIIAPEIATSTQSTTTEPQLLINTTSFSILLADTATERERGLSGRKNLEATEAMLFIFADSDYHGIWMKDMNFPIDIIWLDAEKRIVTIRENITPATYPTVFEPTSPARYVIELNGGLSRKHNFQAGHKVNW